MLIVNNCQLKQFYQECQKDKYIAIDQGPILLMIENYRTQLLWNLFMQDLDIIRGLDNLGFNF